MAIPTRFSSSSLVIFCFLLIIFLRTINPSVLAARRLQSGNGDFFGEQKDDQGKSGVRGSQSRPAGSANGQHSPSRGTVQMPPPTPVPIFTYQSSPGYHYVHVSSPGHQYEQVASNSSYSHETRNGNYYSHSEHHENSTYRREEHHGSVRCSSTTLGQQECQHYP